MGNGVWSVLEYWEASASMRTCTDTGPVALTWHSTHLKMSHNTVCVCVRLGGGGLCPHWL